MEALFESYKLFNICELYNASLLKLMHRYHHEKLPPALCDVFVANNQVHVYNTRNSTTPHLFAKCTAIYYK